MRTTSLLRLSLGLALALSPLDGTARPQPASPVLASRNPTEPCLRDCMTDIVRQVLDSMVAHDPDSLPLATIYKGTENSHPAAVTMMTSWRTITDAGPPSLLAIDTMNGTAYFALDVIEGDFAAPNVLRGRIKVVDREITELELFINRYRGDHGFSFSAAELPSNYKVLMNPPSNRTKPSRADLEALSAALFATSSDPANNLSVTVSDSCQFTEIGWKVVDTGVYGNGSTDPLGCTWPSDHPYDANARVGLVIDEELGFVVTSGMIQGTVFPYQNVSAFIPNSMTSAQEAQEVWYNGMIANGTGPLLAPFGATGETLEVLQLYNGELQAMQINVFLSGPNMTSAWL